MRLNYIPNTKPNYNRYGYLYNWHAVNDAANIAASGWHMPTETEWATLTTWLTNNGYGYGGSGSDIAKAMASGSLWTANGTPGNVGNDQGTNNSSGLNTKPNGYRAANGTFTYINEVSNSWTSTEYSGTEAKLIYLSYNYAYVTNIYISKLLGASIRLVKDDDTLATYTGNDGRTYSTVKLGTQVWMAENLKETLYRDTSAIPEVTGNAAWAALTTDARCSYSNA